MLQGTRAQRRLFAAGAAVGESLPRPPTHALSPTRPLARSPAPPQIWRTPFTPQLVRMLRPPLADVAPAYRRARAYHAGIPIVMRPDDPALELLRELRVAAAESQGGRAGRQGEGPPQREAKRRLGGGPGRCSGGCWQSSGAALRRCRLWRLARRRRQSASA